MKTKNNSNSAIYILISVFLSAAIILLQSCGIEDSSMQPKGDYISGYAIFVDTSLYRSGGYYGVALYNKVQHAFTYQPAVISALDFSYQAPNPVYWRISKEGTGEYYAAIVWVRENSPELPVVLGTYGCDTNHACTGGEVIAFPNYSGANYNIRCWSDTTNGLN